MQLAEEQPATRTDISVSPSLVLDLAWVLHAANKPSLRERHRDLGELFVTHPELEERILGFWSDGPACFTDLETLAHLSGALSQTDPQEVLAKVRIGFDLVPDDLAILSETPQDESAVVHRLVRLRDDRTLRRRYMDLLEQVTAAVIAPWLDHGLPAARSAAETVAAQLSQGARWYDLTSNTCEGFLAHQADIVARVDRGTPLLLALCAYFGSALYLQFEDAIVVGRGVQRDDLASRVRTEDLARRLKALADPTRLAIVDFVATSPRSVGEITQAFRLAQPTVSNHVKLLREAGIIATEREGGRTLVKADRRAVTELLDRLSAVVT